MRRSASTSISSPFPAATAPSPWSTRSPIRRGSRTGASATSSPSRRTTSCPWPNRWQPMRHAAVAPGTTAAYSNWTTALAGLVVANVSGMTFEEYVARNIFEPLGMHHSSFDEPLPAPLDANMATGYSDVGKVLELLGYEYIRNFGPAGALAATADDMARFIVAHVNGGELNGARILKPETARLMHSRLFGPVEGLPGMAHGFMELWHNGHRFVGHGGDTIAFHSDLAIDPDRGFGFYVSFNAPDGGQARDVVTRAVLNYFYPEAAPAEPAPPPEGTAERVANIVGAYRANRRSHTKLEAVAGLAADIPIVPRQRRPHRLGPADVRRRVRRSGALRLPRGQRTVDAGIRDRRIRRRGSRVAEHADHRLRQAGLPRDRRQPPAGDRLGAARRPVRRHQRGAQPVRHSRLRRHRRPGDMDVVGTVHRQPGLRAGIRPPCSQPRSKTPCRPCSTSRPPAPGRC